MKRLILLFFLLASIQQLNAQEVALLDLNGLERRLENGKDTVFVVNFWATWCAPCVAELPNFEKLQSAYRKEPLKVLLISLDFKSKLDKDVRPFVKKQKLNNEVFLLDEGNQQEFIERISTDWSGALPATLFVKKSVGHRSFFEQEFSYEELEKRYKSINKQL